MELSTFERLLLLNALPEKGDITTIRIVRDLRESLSFNEEEHKRLKFVQEGEQVQWKEDGSKADVEIGDKASKVIVDALEKLSAQGEFAAEHLAVYDRFVTE